MLKVFLFLSFFATYPCVIPRQANRVPLTFRLATVPEMAVKTFELEFPPIQIKFDDFAQTASFRARFHFRRFNTIKNAEIENFVARFEDKVLTHHSGQRNAIVNCN